MAHVIRGTVIGNRKKVGSIFSLPFSSLTSRFMNTWPQISILLGLEPWLLWLCALSCGSFQIENARTLFLICQTPEKDLEAPIWVTWPPLDQSLGWRVWSLLIGHFVSGVCTWVGRWGPAAVLDPGTEPAPPRSGEGGTNTVTGEHV